MREQNQKENPGSVVCVCSEMEVRVQGWEACWSPQDPLLCLAPCPVVQPEERFPAPVGDPVGAVKSEIWVL